MDRRELLVATGALAAAALAGCLGQLDEDDPDTTPDGDDGPDPAGTDAPDGLPGERPAIPEAELQSLAKDNAAFGLDLYRTLSEDSDDNLFLSPYSISVALAMTYAGADGETATEMADVLQFDEDEETHPRFAGMHHELARRAETEAYVPEADGTETADAFKLHVANALWGRSGVEFDDGFIQLIEDYYGAGVAEADFVERPDAERERINEWVAAQTEDRIDELLPPGSISSNTVLVLTNAVYFLASWASQFDPTNTTAGTFTTLDGSESTTPFMVQEIRTDYAAVDGAEAVELRYVGGEVSMVVIRPEAGTFAEFEAGLDADGLFHLFDELDDHRGTVALPTFEIEAGFELGGRLQELGMPRAFGGGADFSEMFEANGSGVFIDEVYHDAFVTIDEEGTEAAAATGVVMDESAPPEWGELRFDRPFIFCIRDRPTDAVLFLGRVTDPIAPDD